MFSYYKDIDENTLALIYEYEEQQERRFKKEVDSLYLNILKRNECNYIISLQRGIESVGRIENKTFDGYTAMLQIDFIDKEGNVIELDESICSFFETITYISFNILKRRYKIFQNEDLLEIRAEIKKFICDFEKLT